GRRDKGKKEREDRAKGKRDNRGERWGVRRGTSLHEQKSELVGINVFKLREIVPMPAFTRPAGMKAPLLGMVTIRDQVIPVSDLPAVAGCKPETGLNIFLITEYSPSVQAFSVQSVENVMLLDWQQVPR
ncbi:chemotaxis protein CheW, partial [Salmonella enterica]|uniref:chemotaxis protein CheW n=1 Tax=Salmonella enterica TaxID=28901 RepID=UPI00398C4261